MRESIVHNGDLFNFLKNQYSEKKNPEKLKSLRFSMAQALDFCNFNQEDNIEEEVFVIEEPDIVYKDDETIGSP
jgi:hypothetical protein